MNELPSEIQKEIRDAWAADRGIPFDYLCDRYPGWREEIEDFIVGFLVDEVDELREDYEIEDLLAKLLDSHDRRERRRAAADQDAGVIDLERWREEREPGN
jgi:glycosyltransferase involved in cell wall biosynthesis